MPTSFADIPEIGLVAWGVIATLLIMSVLSIGIIAERWWVYRRVRRQSKICATEASRLMRLGQLRETLQLTQRADLRESHLAHLIAAGLREWECQGPDDDKDARLDSVRAALQHQVAVSLGDLRRGLVLLGTIASTAPFVGLFGTTFGIINAFGGMALTGSGGLTAISAGISEALITTAFGLFVAVPAVWAYNGLGGRIEGFSIELDRARDQLLLFLARQH